MKRFSVYILVLSMFVALVMAGCKSSNDSPRQLLDKYFTSAQKQDYATTYSCYYKAYQQKVNKDEYIKHRKEASVLKSYKILSISTKNNSGQATVQVTFAPSVKLKRTKAVTVKVKEDLVKEKDGWKIRVW